MTKANEEIRKEMKARGVTYWKLADSLGVSEGTLYRWIRHEFSVDQKQKILDQIRSISL